MEREYVKFSIKASGHRWFNPNADSDRSSPWFPQFPELPFFLRGPGKTGDGNAGSDDTCPTRLESTAYSNETRRLFPSPIPTLVSMRIPPTHLPAYTSHRLWYPKHFPHNITLLKLFHNSLPFRSLSSIQSWTTLPLSCLLGPSNSNPDMTSSHQVPMGEPHL